MTAIPAHDQNMNCDFTMMYFPNRDQFLSTYLHQLFSLPNSMIYYILKKPQSSDVYQKLIRCCKYFFVKNPILVFHCLQLDDDGWKICSDNCKARAFTKKINVNKEILSGCKLWIQDKLRIYSTNSKCASDLIPYVHQCDAEKLQLQDQHISIQQLLFLSRYVKRLTLKTVIINSDADSEVSIQEIVANVQNIERFSVKFDPTSKSNISSDTVKKLLQIPHFKNVNLFSLENISEEFDIETFYNYYKNISTKLFFVVKFHNVLFENYAEKLDKILSDILDIGFKDRLPPLIFYPGQDTVKFMTVYNLFKKYHPYFV